MNSPRVNRPPWTCECGRKVPAHVEACRCGKARPEDTGAGGAADWAEQREAVAPVGDAAEKPGLFSTKSLLQFGGLVMVFVLFFGSRYFNRWRASGQVRTGMIAELSKQIGEERAKEMVDKIHWPCFEPNYHMSFQRRGGSSTFDDEKYGSCAIRALEREVGAMRGSR